ncbi:hypothetical protein B5807_03033 [Epicoccum nigrum]|uniref:AMMECR1 domain-containing protein n=1 Tax=Epicoccum nigrum TaxID=105696 RepID=A0A1Y2MAL8_EPING|nr:hypothetical protein B5807_03033 [Epicoccum nigrum]
MASEAHCAYCFETLAASLEKRPALSLPQVEALWDKYAAATSTSASAPTTETDSPAKPAAISRLLSPATPSSASASSSADSTPTTGASSATGSAGTSVSSLSSTLQKEEETAFPLFVTWNTLSKGGDKRLRGCIGTFEALELEEGLSSYALTSAFDDTRFQPIPATALPTLQVAVTLLTHFEPTPANDPLAWDIGTHGLRISFSYHGRRLGATYLPDVCREQGWAKEECVVSLMRKAGWTGRRDEWRNVAGLKTVRYQGRKASLDYPEWRRWREWVGEEEGEVDG